MKKSIFREWITSYYEDANTFAFAINLFGTLGLPFVPWAIFFLFVGAMIFGLLWKYNFDLNSKAFQNEIMIHLNYVILIIGFKMIFEFK